VIASQDQSSYSHLDLTGSPDLVLARVQFFQAVARRPARCSFNEIARSRSVRLTLEPLVYPAFEDGTEL
jgi:hypothetical protein